MRQIKLFIACSLDGYIARTDGSIDWLFTDGDYGYTDFIRSIDILIMGRKTYEHLLHMVTDYPHQDKQTLVLSHTRAGSRDAHAQFVSGPVRDLVEPLRHTPGGDIWLVGGAEVVRDFLAEGLIDEFILSYHPLLLGSGIPLFLPQSRPISLRLEETLAFPSGLVQLRYRHLPGSV